jgi:hypothetical protein
MNEPKDQSEPTLDRNLDRLRKLSTTQGPEGDEETAVQSRDPATLLLSRTDLCWRYKSILPALDRSLDRLADEEPEDEDQDPA